MRIRLKDLIVSTLFLLVFVKSPSASAGGGDAYGLGLLAARNTRNHMSKIEIKQVDGVRVVESEHWRAVDVTIHASALDRYYTTETQGMIRESNADFKEVRTVGRLQRLPALPRLRCLAEFRGIRMGGN